MSSHYMNAIQRLINWYFLLLYVNITVGGRIATVSKGFRRQKAENIR